MIIFSCLKKEFDLYVKEGIISNKVYDAYKEKMGKKTKLNQIKSWANSLPMMSFILQDLPDNTGISIEFNIPLTSKRIDLVVSGYNLNREPVLLLFELKQREVISDVKSEDAVIKTITFKGNEAVSSNNLLKILESNIGQTATEQNIAGMRKLLTRYYNASGYYSALIFPDISKLSSGELIFEIKEGGKNSVTIQ